MSKKTSSSGVSLSRPMLHTESEPEGEALAPLARAIVELAIQIWREERREKDDQREAA